jgi:hypothetical protein
MLETEKMNDIFNFNSELVRLNCNYVFRCDVIVIIMIIIIIIIIFFFRLPSVMLFH